MEPTTPGMSSTAVRVQGRIEVTGARAMNGVLYVDRDGGIRGACIQCGAPAVIEQRRRVSFSPQLPRWMFILGALFLFAAVVVAATRIRSTHIWIGYCGHHLRMRRAFLAGAALLGSLTAGVGAYWSTLGPHQGSRLEPLTFVVLFLGTLGCVAGLLNDYSVKAVDEHRTAHLLDVDERVLRHLR